MADPLQTAVFGAVAAALAYVVNLGGRSIDQLLVRRAARKTSLIDLQSHLLASQSAFQVQSALRDRLTDEIAQFMPQLANLGYDEILAQGFPFLTDDQKRVHGLIRVYTMKAIKPLNEAMSAWLKQDHDFKHKADRLGFALQRLEAHLALWHAKYDFWMESHPERALVYLADEENHGVGFPVGIEKLVVERTSNGKSALAEAQEPEKSQ